MAKNIRRKRPCCICRKWFQPIAQQKERQKTCGPACRKELHRRQCEQWNRKNKAYFKNNYLADKLQAIEEEEHDAHLMEKESLMDICSLMFNPQKETVAASFIFVGDETFEKKLSLQILASVKTRLTGQFNLNPLNDNESLEFIKFRLSNAGANETLFDPDALNILSSHCRGNRRHIMNMGTLLLTEAFYRQEKTISAELIFNCDQIEISE